MQYANCQGLKEIESIWVILKESINWGEKKEESIQNTKKKKYISRYHKHASKVPTITNKYG